MILLANVAPRPLKAVLAAALVAAVLVLGHGAAGATPAPRWIVFSGHLEGTTANPPQLLRVRTDGTGLREITSGVKAAIQPTFTPDGKQVVFTRLGSGVFRVSVDGSGLRRLTSGGRDIYPVPSPDGKLVAFLRPVKAAWRLHVVPLAGGPARILKQAPPAGRASWTRDGKAMLIPSGGDLIRVDARTGRPLAYGGLTLDIQTTQDATVSPDGRTVAYVGPRLSTGAPDCGEGRCPQFALYLARVPAPHRPRKLVNDTGPAGWSPDGKSLAYVHLGALNLRTVASGRTTTISTKPHLAGGDAPPTWQPR